jgi:hypothetical protein
LYIQIRGFIGVEMDDGSHFADASRQAPTAGAAKAIVNVKLNVASHQVIASLISWS